MMNLPLRMGVVVWMVVLLSLQVWAHSSSRPFIWADDEDYKPLIYRDENGKSAGVFYDVVTEAFRRMGVPLQNRLYPWSRAQKLVKEKKADGMVTVYTKSRQKFLVASEPIVTVEERVFVSKNNPKLREILSIDSIEGLKKFVIVDTMGAGWSKENLKGMKIIWVPTPESALNMVASGRADIYLMNNFAGPYFIKEQIKKGGPLHDKLQDVVMGRFPFAKMQYRLLIRKDSPYVKIVDKFNKTLREMRKDGTCGRIVQKYLIDMTYDIVERNDKCSICNM